MCKLTYDPTHKHAVSAYNGVSYGYDPNRSMTDRSRLAISYDPESRPLCASTGPYTACRFAYDGDGVRRKRLDYKGTIHYVRSSSATWATGRTPAKSSRSTTTPA